MFSIMRRKFPTTEAVSKWLTGKGRGLHTQHNDHEVPEAKEAGRGGRVVAQGRRPDLRVHGGDMPVLALQGAAKLGDGRLGGCRLLGGAILCITPCRRRCRLGRALEARHRGRVHDVRESVVRWVLRGQLGSAGGSTSRRMEEWEEKTPSDGRDVA
jgi:hypothetical protein